MEIAGTAHGPAQDEAWRDRAEKLEETCQQLRDQLVRYRELFEFAPDAYLVTDLFGTITDANHTATVLLHVPKEFLVGKPLPLFAPEPDRKEFYRRLNRQNVLLNVGQLWEVRLQPRKAEPRVVSLTATFIGDQPGQATGFRWLLRDVTARCQAEEDLRREKEFVEGLLDATLVFVLVLDAEGRILRANAYLEEMTGRDRRDLPGQAWWGLLARAEWQAAVDLVLEARTTRRVIRRVLALRDRGGGTRPVEWVARPLGGGAGRGEAALLVVGHDLTELQEAQRQALRLERLAAIGQMAAGLAHESRNALQRGQACLERLRWMLQGQPGALDLLARARRAQDDLVHLYEDVREYAAPITLDRRPCDLAEVWRQAWADLLALAPGRDARLAENCPADSVCLADPFRLRQVFRNMLENALAACPDPVRVEIACAEADLAGRPALRAAIRDNGPGLDAEQRRRLFEPFYTTKVRGTGLGMAIAKRIVEAHGGQIVVGDRPPGTGAEVVVVLPRGTDKQTRTQGDKETGNPA